MLSKFAEGMVYFSILSDEERELIVTESQKQYSIDKNIITKAVYL